MHRVSLFTDTLGDLNGVSRFIQDMGELAAKDDQLALQLNTSTAKSLPTHPWITNLPWRFRMPMPFYQEMDLVWPLRQTIRQQLIEQRPDSVHISTPGPFGWVAKQEAQKLRLPLLGTYHTDFPAYLHDLTRSNWVKRRTDRVMADFYRPFQSVFSRSHAYDAIMQQDIDLAPDVIHTLPPGTRLDRFHPGHRDRSLWTEFGLRPDRRKILYVGRINIEKGVPFLLDVWQRLQRAHGDLGADLVLVGEGRYRKQADKLRPHRIYFTGPVRGRLLSMIYASADLFVFPSVTDTLGQVIMEAQASGLGCLVSDQGGPQTLVTDHRTGRILPAMDHAAWERALLNALRAPDQCRDWGLAARQPMLDYDIRQSYDAFKHQHLSI
ncbi:glycosyltransferase family 1 protein [Thiomicrospira sp. WB1]|uniref:glycosyltransferase family 4 protein n=1 Tax=Thiomicrospira sp. WB1 TaxID=1685380 RepID=UPI00074752E4|nr:glycosyltransferase family 1 protein [Thiomicrospira sp. WB1]KUJ71775.1 group 1 glycosyl transferase [Thiomicrospira sp. WB1]